MGAAAKSLQHPEGIGNIGRLAQISPVEHHLGVGAQDHRRARLLLRDGTGLGEGHGDHGEGGVAGWVPLGDMARLNRESETEAGQELLTAGRGGGENELRDAAQLTIKGCLSVMMRVFLSSAWVRNFGRLKE